MTAPIVAKRSTQCRAFRISPKDTNYFALLFDPEGDQVDLTCVIEIFTKGGKTPRFMVVPHENAALSMAHGYTMITGKPQAVMLHTNVGTANAINMLINASRDRVPMLLTSGRTPFTESGAEGSRSVHIHWSQEMFDQAGMLREVVKWDYEMKRGDQAATTVDRAMEIATTSPPPSVSEPEPSKVCASFKCVSSTSRPRSRPCAASSRIVESSARAKR